MIRDAGLHAIDDPDGFHLPSQIIAEEDIVDRARINAAWTYMSSLFFQLPTCSLPVTSLDSAAS